MENTRSTPIPAQEQVGTERAFISNVFSWMFMALTISGIMAYTFGNSLSLLQLLIDFETGKLNVLGWIVMLAPLGFVLAMSFAFNKLSYPMMILFFIAYALVNGISLSFIFLIYNIGSIYITFGVTAATFGVMALAGYYTQTDLTKMGSLLYMGLIGLVIAGLINMFIGSEKADYIISFFGVAIFTGLTAYDIQKLKRIGAGVEYGTATTSKLAVMGALNLYLDFVNLFLYLLRFFGRKK
jgi:FtsH-binding integral membrane protein